MAARSARFPGAASQTRREVPSRRVARSAGRVLEHAGGPVDARAEGAPCGSRRHRPDSRKGGHATAGFAASAALRSRDGATIDPYRATLGLAAAAAARGAQIFERSPVRKTSFTRTQASLALAGGLVTARRVIVATGAPTLLFGRSAPLRLQTAYFALTEPVPAKLRSTLGARDHVLRDWASTPPHRIGWTDDERLLVSGAESDAMPPGFATRVLVQRTGQLMYELSTFYPGDLRPAGPPTAGIAAHSDDAARAAVHRPASQLPASPVCASATAAVADRRLSRQPHPAAPSSRTSRSRRTRRSGSRC